MVRIGGGSAKFVLSDRWIVYTKSRIQLLHRKYLLYETGCSKNSYLLPPLVGFGFGLVQTSVDGMEGDMLYEHNSQIKIYCVQIIHVHIFYKH